MGVGIPHIGGGVAQQHQCDHDEVFGDGDAVGTGGVGQDHVGGRVEGVIQIGIHTGEVAAEPLQAGEGPEGGAIRHAIQHLVLPGQLRRHVAVGIIVHGKAAACRGAVDLRMVMRLQKISEYSKLFHRYTSSNFSAQRIPSAAAERMPPA